MVVFYFHLGFFSFMILDLELAVICHYYLRKVALLCDPPFLHMLLSLPFALSPTFLLVMSIPIASETVVKQLITLVQFDYLGVRVGY